MAQKSAIATFYLLKVAPLKSLNLYPAAERVFEVEVLREAGTGKANGLKITEKKVR